MVGIVLLGVFVLLLAFGAPIAVCLGMSSVAAMLVQGAGKTDRSSHVGTASYLFRIQQ